MKFNKNNQKQSLAFLTLLSFWAIAISPATAAIEPSSKEETSVPAIERQLENQENEKPLEPKVGTDDEETWEKVELEKEWENILGDESEEEMLLASDGRTF